MSHIKKTLMSGERVVYKTRQHEIRCLCPGMVLVFGTLLGLSVFLKAGSLFGAAIVFASLAYGAPALGEYFAAEFGVTNRRVFVKTGLIGCKSMETVLSKVGVITVQQDVWGKLFGYGTVTVTGFGGAKEDLQMVPQPYKFRRKIFEQVSAQ